MARRILHSLVVLLALAGCLSPAAAESVKDMPQPTNYINDYAGVLSDSTRSDLDAQLRALDQQAGAQVFVAVIHKMEDAESPAEFANGLFAKWKPGQKGKAKGVVLVLAVDDHKYQFEIGYGLEGILPDARTGDIGRDMVPDLKDGNYNGAVRTAVDEVSDVIAKDAGVTLQTAPTQTYRERQRKGSPFTGILVFAAIFFFIFLSSRGGGGGGRYGGGGGGFLTGMLLGNILGGGGRGGNDWGGGGGGWGGGDSGGGFSGGGFSGGGGGDSGGGGAGGGW